MMIIRTKKAITRYSSKMRLRKL